MDKKNYSSPTISYIGPDVDECKEVDAPLLAAVGASVLSTIVSRIW